MKILFVSNTSSSMIKFRFGIIKKLISLGYDVFVIAPFDQYSKEIKDIGCKYFDIKMGASGTNPFYDLLFFIKLLILYFKISPDLIFHYSIKPNIFGSISAKILNIKSISIIAGLGYVFLNDNFLTKVTRKLYKFSLQFATKVLFINKDDLEECINLCIINRDKTYLINGEGINTSFFYPMTNTSEKEYFTFLMIARLLKDKGIYEYVEAAKIIMARYKQARFELLGPIYVQNPACISVDEIQKLHNDGVVFYYGEALDVRRYIANADCIVLPSYREGVSMTLMEAASMGKPIIATNVPGCKEVVEDGINGFTCEVQNPNDLARKMEIMINLSYEARSQMGKNGRIKMINEFDEAIIINEYLKIIKNFH